ncbi:spore wall protein 2-like [Larimichthys crocea]|uniref:spore wall protein 2-like n=1 Tax=Larimichthys crocea TaxID=215358 RepID=UPI000F5FC1A6|nr:spore wall protein 2-like [Larimichthys crocea]
MIKLLTIVIVAGLIYESHQYVRGSPNSGKRYGYNNGKGWHQSWNERREASHFNQMKPGCSAGQPCNNPTQIIMGSYFPPMQPGCSAGWPCHYPTQISVESNCAPIRPDEQRCYYPTHIQCWTPWFDRKSITDDWETFQYLHREHPEEICPNPVDIQTNGQNIRFSCYPPFCGGGVCWTRWFDSVRSKGSVSVQISRATCDYPLYIEAVTVKSMTPATDTGEIFKTLNPTEGFVCRDVDQDCDKKQCSDYKVRFGCACSDGDGNRGEGNGGEGNGNGNGGEGNGGNGNGGDGNRGEGNGGKGNGGNGNGNGGEGKGGNGNGGDGNRGKGNGGKGNGGEGNGGEGNGGSGNSKNNP